MFYNIPHTDSAYKSRYQKAAISAYKSRCQKAAVVTCIVHLLLQVIEHWLLWLYHIGCYGYSYESVIAYKEDVHSM